MTEINNAIGFPLLSLLIFLPLAGAVVLAIFVPSNQEKLLKVLALGLTCLIFFISLLLYKYFDISTHEMQFVEHIPWIESFGISYYLGIDGISLLLILLTTLITPICILCSWEHIKDKVKAYLCLFLFLETGMLGVFMALDFFLFYVFWEVMLIPMFFIIGVWGGERRLYAAIKFFLFTFLGSLFMLIGIITLYYAHGEMTSVYTLNVMELVKSPVSADLQFWIFLAFFLGFAIKVPMFPFHTWLPDAHVEAPTAGSVILAGILLKMGTYGFIRFSIPLLPNASIQLAPFIIALSLVAILYGAWLSLNQRDMKKLVAYSSVSHMGFVMLGMFLLNMEGLKGSVLQMINHGVSTSGLFLIVGLLYERRHTRMIDAYGGVFKRMPFYTILTFIIILSSFGLPATNGFVGELHVLIGAYRGNPLFALVVVGGVILGAAYLLWMFQRVMLAKESRKENGDLLEINFREIVTLVPIIVLIFWIGLYPDPFIEIIEPPVEHILSQLSNHVSIAAK